MRVRKIFAVVICLIVALCCFGCGEDGKPAPDKTYVMKLQRGQITLMTDNDDYKSASISATVSEKGGEAIENAKITYTVQDPAIATVNGDGVVTAVKDGQTDITLTYGNATATVTVIVGTSITAEQVNTFDEKYVKQWGRVFTDNSKLNVHHVASGFEITFVGTSLTADIEVTEVRYPTARARVFVDGDEEGIFTTIETKEDFELVSGLSEGVHTVRVLKSSEIIDSLFSVSNLSADGFATPPAKAKYRFEFIGDSITAGFGSLGKQADVRSMDNSDGCKSYSLFAAQHAKADLSVVAVSGICVKVAYNPIDPKMRDVYPLLSYKATPAVEYDFSDKVDAVVLNLGTNESSYLDHGAEYALYAQQYHTDYAEFLSYIRSKRPDAYIVCVYGSMTTNNRIMEGIKKAIQEVDDDKIVLFEKITPNVQGVAMHPNRDAHKKNGVAIADFIMNLLEK